MTLHAKILATLWILTTPVLARWYVYRDRHRWNIKTSRLSWAVVAVTAVYSVLYGLMWVWG